MIVSLDTGFVMDMTTAVTIATSLQIPACVHIVIQNIIFDVILDAAFHETGHATVITTVGT